MEEPQISNLNWKNLQNIFSETVPYFSILYQIISSQGVHDTLMYSMDKFDILKVVLVHRYME